MIGSQHWLQISWYVATCFFTNDGVGLDHCPTQEPPRPRPWEPEEDATMPPPLGAALDAATLGTRQGAGRLYRTVLALPASSNDDAAPRLEPRAIALSQNGYGSKCIYIYSDQTIK